MNLNISLGVGGTMWFTVSAPALRGDAILSVYYLSVYGKEEKAL